MITCPQWEERQKHHEAYRKAVKLSGCLLDAKGIIWKYKGKEFFEELNKLGHTHATFELCECSKSLKRLDSSGMVIHARQS